MRNWNDVSITGKFKSFGVASLPMRNWNKFLLSLHSQHQERCEPTYEELKLSSRYKHDEFYRSCEPTYEELKLAFLISLKPSSPKLRAYLWGIETNCLHLVRVVITKVASLPMRNWNIPPTLTLGRRPSSCEPTYEELKHGSGDNKTDKIGGCEPTYEELKHKTNSGLAISKHLLRAYLWGIETLLKLSNRRMKWVLRAYLWGMLLGLRL